MVYHTKSLVVSVMTTFEMTNLRLLQYFLGFVVKQDLNSVCVCQEKYFTPSTK